MISAVGAGLYGLHGCSAVDSGAPQAADKGAGVKTASAPSIEIPKFGRPEEAKRYFAAMTEGDRRSLALLNEALERARQTPGTDPKHVAELERDRAARSARLAVYENELSTLSHVDPGAP